MSAKSVLMFLFLLSAMGLRFAQVCVTRADTSIFRVPTDFPTIQAAINAAQNGSTILVDNGVYHEHLLINKTLTLLGADKEDTVIDGSYSGGVVTVTGDNVLLDGFTVRNSSFDKGGILLEHSIGSIVSGNIATLNVRYGIALDNSFNNTVSDNIASSNGDFEYGVGDGVRLLSSANNTIRDNVITPSAANALELAYSDNNTICRNVVENNLLGVDLYASDNNTIFQNNFINNYIRFDGSSSGNVWSANGRGNYWDNYTGLDDGSGGRTMGDGVGDTNVPWYGVDDCPLVNPVNPLLICWNNEVFPTLLVSNNTVSAFSFDQADKEITGDLIGPANTTGYFSLSAPATLLSGPWTVLLDGADVTSKAIITENQTYTTIYLNYSDSTHNVQAVGTHVIPEYPTATALLFLTLLAPPLTTLILRKRKRKHSYQ